MKIFNQPEPSGKIISQDQVRMIEGAMNEALSTIESLAQEKQALEEKISGVKKDVKEYLLSRCSEAQKRLEDFSEAFTEVRK